MLFKDLSFIGKLISFKISKRELVVGRRRANLHFFIYKKEFLQWQTIVITTKN